MPTPQQFQEFGTYMTSYTIAKNALVAESQYLASIWNGVGTTLSARADARAADAYIHQQILILDNAYLTVFNKFQAGVHQPSPAEVQTAYTLANQIATLVRNNAITNTILAAIAQDVGAFAKIGNS